MKFPNQVRPANEPHVINSHSTIFLNFHLNEMLTDRQIHLKR